MKKRDHERIVREMSEQIAEERKSIKYRNAELLCTYLRDETLTAVLHDLEQAYDSSSVFLLLVVRRAYERRLLDQVQP
jgi:hypothetical protein